MRVTRTLLDVNVLHDRNPVAVKLADGSIRNAYTVRLLNKRGFDRVIAIDVDGPVNATLHVVGADSVAQDRPMIVLARDTTTELRLLVTAPAENNPGKSASVHFRVTDIGLGEVAALCAAVFVALCVVSGSSAAQFSRVSESGILNAMNQVRVAAGLRPLSFDGKLHAAARAHSADMIRRGYFGHGAFSVAWNPYVRGSAVRSCQSPNALSACGG